MQRQTTMRRRRQWLVLPLTLLLALGLWAGQAQLQAHDGAGATTMAYWDQFTQPSPPPTK